MEKKSLNEKSKIVFMVISSAYKICNIWIPQAPTYSTITWRWKQKFRNLPCALCMCLIIPELFEGVMMGVWV